ncbi:hypothetical protein AB0E62_34220 [Streptomyces sp. NPDC038707]|uniref:hypothetical protein n=1 Tax=Streptomyces sp. NPDC038707 TaxID=3154329 RepID=UPI0033CF2828
MNYANQLRKLAGWHTEQADSLARDGDADDGLFSQRDAVARKATREAAIEKHRRKAAELEAEAAAADQ